jgi:predicted lipoprotein
MGESEQGQVAADNTSRAGFSWSGGRRLLILAVAGGGLLWFFPLFRVVPLAPATGTTATPTATFDPVAAAQKIWRNDLPAAVVRAVDLATLAALLRADAEKTAKQFARSAGLGTAYYFVRGSGRVVERDRNFLRVAVDGAEAAIVAIRIGPIFGNTLRDGCGLLDVNAFPGLQEFNALSAELNGLAEKSLLPLLRERATVGASLRFAGCAEAPEAAPEAGEPLLQIVPVQAEIR